MKGLNVLENWEALTSYDKAFFYALLDEKVSGERTSESGETGGGV